MIEFALSWISRYVGPKPMSWGGAIGMGGSISGKKMKAINIHLQLLLLTNIHVIDGCYLKDRQQDSEELKPKYLDQ